MDEDAERQIRCILYHWSLWVKEVPRDFTNMQITLLIALIPVSTLTPQQYTHTHTHTHRHR
jgi:hypothetical protein